MILVEGGRKDAIIISIQAQHHMHHVPEMDRVDVGREVLHHQPQQIPLLRLPIVDRSGGLTKLNINLQSRYRLIKSHGLAIHKKRRLGVLKQAMKAKYPT